MIKLTGISKKILELVQNIYNKRFLIILLDICLIFAIIQVSTGYDEILLKQEQTMMYESEPVGIDYYYQEKDINNISGDMAINNMIKCYQ